MVDREKMDNGKMGVKGDQGINATMTGGVQV